MLTVLHIENIAVIEKADIEFSSGLNVMTGETGAGKSIVIDSISAVLGERTSRELIRTGAQSALVTAVFNELPNELSWLEESGISPDEEGNLLLMRKITADGKNSCRVNGCPVTVAQLKALGREILNIHGQHDSLQMFDEDYQLQFVDGFASLKSDEYKKRFGEYREILKEIEKLTMDESEKERKKDVLTFQIAELEAARLREGEDDELEARRLFLKDAGKRMESIEKVFLLFDGDDEKGGIYAATMNAERLLSSGAMRGADGFGQGLNENVSELCRSAGDILEQLRDIKNELEFSPEEYDKIETRLSALNRLSRKYGGNVGFLLGYLEKCRVELDNIEYAGDRLIKLNKQLDIVKKDCEMLAQKLTNFRKEAASRLKQRILDELLQLDMPKVRLDIVFSEKSMDASGKDVISFEMSTNPGENLRPISKIASGGELSRIMLSLKTVLAENDMIGTLIFDEVDSGVSGKAAQKVGAKLREVARHRQVISVTHLPQVAAYADAHLKVTKNIDGTRTDISVSQLSREERIEEIARIISGERITEVSLKHAEEMLTMAEGT
jgi:DNA repair protein RecN (Recombination protein N)